MAINGLGGFVGQLQQAASGIAEQLEQQAPAELKPQVQQAADQFQEVLSNPAGMLNQLGIPTTPALPPLETPAQVSAAYASGARKDLTDAGTLKQLNKEVSPETITQADVEKQIANTEVKLLSKDDYKALKQATGVQGADLDNPATAIDANSRRLIREQGPENLAKARNGGKPPSADQIAQARKDLEKIDPSLFKGDGSKMKDGIYVNQRLVNGVADPRLSKVAGHEYLHLILEKKGVHGEAAQHGVTGRLGWNQKAGPGGQNDHWGDPPGKGLPPK